MVGSWRRRCPGSRVRRRPPRGRRRGWWRGIPATRGNRSGGSPWTMSRQPLPSARTGGSCSRPRRSSGTISRRARASRCAIRPKVFKIAMSPDGSLLAGVANASIVLFDAMTGETQQELSTGSNSGFLPSFSDDGRLVATISAGSQEALVWVVATGELQARLSLGAGVDRAAFSPDGSTLYTAGDDAALRQWDLVGSRRFLAQVAPRASFGWGEGALHRSRRAPRRLPVGDPGRVPRCPGRAVRDGARPTARVHRGLGRLGSSRQPVCPAHRRPGHSLGHPRQRGRQSGATRGGGEVTGIDFSTDGSRLAIVDVSGVVVMVDPATLGPVGAPVGLDDVPCAVSLGPDNRTAFVATGPPKSAWEFWRVPCSEWALLDLETGSLLDRGTTDLEGGIRRIDFSPDGSRVAVVGSGDLVELDLETRRPVRPPVAVHDGSVLSLAYSPDGGRILTSGTDGSAALWDADTGRLIDRVVTPELFSVVAVPRRRTIRACRGRRTWVGAPLGHPSGLRRRVRLPARGTGPHEG